MKRIVFGSLLTLALLASGCHKNEKTPSPSTGTVKPEVDTGHEMSVTSPTPEPSPSAVAVDEEGPGDEFGGTPHDPNCTEDHFGVGKGLVESKQLDDGIAELEKGVYDEPENFDMRKTLAEAYLAKGDTEKAIGHFEVAVDQVDDGDTWLELAQAYFDVQDYDQAIRAIGKVAKLDPSNPEPWRLLARAYQSKNMWKESIDASEEAIARGSDSPWTFNNLGYAYLVLGKSDDAIRELEKAVSFDTGVSPAIWNNLGLAYEKKGELADAANAYRAALAGKPDYVKAKVNLNRLTTVAKQEGIAIGERKAEVGPEVTQPAPVSSPMPTPTTIENTQIGEKN